MTAKLTKERIFTVSTEKNKLKNKRLKLVVISSRSNTILPTTDQPLSPQNIVRASLSKIANEVVAFPKSFKAQNKNKFDYQAHQAHYQYEGNLVLVADLGPDSEFGSLIPEYGVIASTGGYARGSFKGYDSVEEASISLTNMAAGLEVGKIISLEKVTVDSSYENFPKEFFVADVEVMFDDPVSVSKKETNSFVDLLIDKSSRFLKHKIGKSPASLDKDFINVRAHKSMDYSKVVYSIASLIGPDANTYVLKNLLDVRDPMKRTELFIEFLSFTIREVPILDDKIKGEVKAAVEKNQKEYYINEHIKALRNELSFSEGSSDDLLEAKIKNSLMPKSVKDRAMQEFRKYQAVSASGSEAYVIRNYIEILLATPWSGDLIPAPSVIKSQEILNKSHFGLEKVKQKILEYIAVLERGEIQRAPILCLIGPPGVGKTSLGESIAESLNRKFVRLSLGGMNDEAEIRGHRKTYVGSMPGRIIQRLSKVGVNNPLFLLDEIDKLGTSHKGDPAAALLEVLDPEQNKAFNDNYLEVDYDLSKVLFIATSNSYNIPEALIDRMDIVELGSYTHQEKFNIAKNHLIPRVFSNNFVKNDEIKISDDVLTYLIDGYTLEPGVRNLEKRLQNIIRYIIKEQSLNKKKSVKVTEALIEKILGPKPIDIEDRKKEKPQVGEITGLAYNSIGGSILQIEVATMPGKGKIQHTGSLGDNIKESVNYAISAIRTSAANFKIDPNFYEKTDIHVHFPNAATKKDGPSAGAAITTAIISSLINKPIPSYIGMTGEVSLRGKVLKIGGIKEKTMAAARNGITHIILPKSNVSDLYEIPEEIKAKINFYPVEHINEILPMVFEEKFKNPVKNK